MPKNPEDGKPKGMAFVTYKDEAGVKAALAYNEQEYGGRYLRVSKASDRPEKGKGKGKDGKDKGKGKDGKGSRGNNELTVFVRGLPFSCDEESLRKDFAEC